VFYNTDDFFVFLQVTINRLACDLANLTSLIGSIYVKVSESGDDCNFESIFFLQMISARRKKNSISFPQFF